MPGTLSDALRESYASNNRDRGVEYGCLELHHDALAVPPRICLGWETVTARLEATAPANAGELVTFEPVQIDAKPPEIVSGEEPAMEVTIYAVTRDIIVSLDEASSAAPTTLLLYYRIYLSTRLDIGPEAPFPLKMSMRDVKVNMGAGTISGKATYRSLANRSFPNSSYTPYRFPYSRRS